MSRRKLVHIVLNALVATAFPTLAWTYLNWRYKLGVGSIYVWPWVFIVTVWGMAIEHKDSVYIRGLLLA